MKKIFTLSVVASLALIATANAASTGSTMTGATMTGSTMTGSIMTGSTMTGSTMTGSTMTGSTMTGSTMTPEATAKAFLKEKATILEGIAKTVKTKEKALQEKVVAIVENFKKSADEYTKHVGVYLAHLLK